jgi:lipid A 3-O-deacylase
MTRLLTCLICTLLLCTTAFSQSAPAELKPWNQNSFDFETGMLWKAGGDTSFNYRIVPFMVSWRSREVFGFDFANGSRITLRNKVTAMANWFETGSENRYLGFSGAPSIEWWDPTVTWSVFGAIGGGIGWVDAQNVPGGQGQDFTLNWYGQLGVSRVLTETWSVRASAMFQHHSNGGQTNPNPGLDSLGVLIGLSRDF